MDREFFVVVDVKNGDFVSLKDNYAPLFYTRRGAENFVKMLTTVKSNKLFNRLSRNGLSIKKVTLNIDGDLT